MGFGQRNCAVFGCHNSGKRLDKWSRERYEVHNSLIRGKTPCVCEPPLKLFAFPTIKKNSEARKTLDKAYETPRSQRETLGT